MKRIIVLALLIAVSLLEIRCKKAEENNTSSENTSVADENTKYSKILFEEYVFDFGKIKQGDTVKHVFVFKNDGTEPLLISNAVASCGCTVPVWTKDPVKPGEKGEILVQFNSTGKSGTQNKTVVVTANTLPNTTTLSLKGEVEAPQIEQK
jgi:hypothetical protein